MIDYVYIVYGEYVEDGEKRLDIILVTNSYSYAEKHVKAWKKVAKRSKYSNVCSEGHSLLFIKER